MRVVIYTRGFEPITVIDVPLRYIELGRKYGQFRVAVPSAPLTLANLSAQPVHLDFRVVDIRVERLSWFGDRKDVLIADDDELALLLTPSWLPGQQGEINAYERRIRTLVDFMFRAG